MGRTLKDKIANLSAERRDRVREETQHLIDEELSLRELRRHLTLTQTQLAERLGVGQDEVSRTERRADMLLSTLRNYIEAMGGTLDIVAQIPGRAPVHITQLRDILEREERETIEEDAPSFAMR
ncbi:MAG: XRE family transcriptional regulator [Rhodospirillales bacterium]|nr:XRE family transcriptional regulator [Rhodospirillales bacterium]